MKNILIILFLFVLIIHAKTEVIDAPRINLEGKITDRSGEAVIGASIYIPELKTGGLTNNQGKFRIDNLPVRKIQIQISSVGYQLIVDNIDLSTTNVKDYILEESVTEIKEVAITGQAMKSELSKIPSPISIVTTAKLQQQA